MFALLCSELMEFLYSIANIYIYIYILSTSVVKPTIILPTAPQILNRSPVHMTTFGTNGGSGSNGVGGTNGTPIGINSVSSSNSNIKMIEHSSAMSPQHHHIDIDDYVRPIMLIKTLFFCC